MSQSTSAPTNPEAVKTMTHASLPFVGLKVLDLAWVVAGPLIGRTLADYGATVVRIDSSRRADVARFMGPFPNGVLDPQQSTLYENCNAGKFGLSLDLSTEAAREVVRDLAAWADVAVESFTPGQLAKWGLGYDSLAARNPGLIMVSTSLMGQAGRYSRYSGFGNHGGAVAGFQNIVGPAGGIPTGPFGPYTDYVAPRFGLVSMLAALDARRRTGRGCHLDVAQSEAGMQFLAPQIAAQSVTGRGLEAQGNRDPLMAPHGVFRTAGWDQWIALAVRNDNDWQRLARLMGGAALAADARFLSLAGRKENEDAVEALVASWTRHYIAADLELLLQQAGIPAHQVAATEEFMADTQLAARGHFVKLDHPLMGQATVEASRYQLSATPAAYVRSAPVYGRDNAHVLRDLLGYDEAHIARLDEAGALA